MRPLLLIPVFASVALLGAEPAAPTVREKLLARILESVPPPPPPASTPPPPDAGRKDVPALLIRLPSPPPARPPSGESEKLGPPVLLTPVIVADSRIREVATAIAREEQDRREGAFSPLDGGKIATLGRWQIGGWWDPSEGWTFLRRNKAPAPLTGRQRATLEARMKELGELLQMGEKPKR